MTFITHPLNTDLLSEHYKQVPDLTAVGHKGTYNMPSFLKVLHHM